MIEWVAHKQNMIFRKLKFITICLNSAAKLLQCRIKIKIKMSALSYKIAFVRMLTFSYATTKQTHNCLNLVHNSKCNIAWIPLWSHSSTKTIAAVAAEDIFLNLIIQSFSSECSKYSRHTSSGSGEREVLEESLMKISECINVWNGFCLCS